MVLNILTWLIKTVVGCVQKVLEQLQRLKREKRDSTKYPLEGVGKSRNCRHQLSLNGFRPLV